MRASCQRVEQLLHGYRDRELGALGRWRVRRHLGGCADCRGELAGLEALGGFVREALEEDVVPDLWGGIAARLPAEDARRRVEREAYQSGPSSWGRLWAPMGAAAAVSVALAAALVWLQPAAPAPPGGVVRSIYSPARSVVVLEGTHENTIIWVVDDVGERVQGGARDHA